MCGRSLPGGRVAAFPLPLEHAPGGLPRVVGDPPGRDVPRVRLRLCRRLVYSHPCTAMGSCVAYVHIPALRWAPASRIFPSLHCDWLLRR
eukprot:4860913-Pyramimonas_sp.AAC.1